MLPQGNIRKIATRVFLNLSLFALIAATLACSQAKEADPPTGNNVKLDITCFEGTFRFALPPLSPDATVIFSDGSTPHELDLQFQERESPFEGPVLANTPMRFEKGVEGIYPYMFQEKNYQFFIEKGGLKHGTIKVVGDNLRVAVTVRSGAELNFSTEGKSLGRDVKVEVGKKKVDIPDGSHGQPISLSSTKKETLVISFVESQHNDTCDHGQEVVGGEEAEVTIDPGGDL